VQFAEAWRMIDEIALTRLAGTGGTKPPKQLHLVESDSRRDPLLPPGPLGAAPCYPCVTHVLPEIEKVVGATGFEPATP